MRDGGLGTGVLTMPEAVALLLFPPRHGAFAGLLSASDALPALHTDIPWSSAVHRHGKAFERGDRGAKAASQAVLAAALVQVASGLMAGTAAAIASEQ